MIESITTQAAQRATTLTGKLIDTIGTRPSGSAASRQTADALKLEAESFADRAWTEDFEVHPKAFLGWIRILVILYVTAVILLWFQIYWLAAFLTTLGLVIMAAQFFLYRELLDRFFPKETGRNVLAVIEPVGEVKGQLLISGHHDSSFVFNFFANRPELYPARVMGGLGIYGLLLVVSWGLTIWQLAAGAAFSWNWLVTAVFSVLFLWAVQLWWFASPDATPGAGDNLASSAAAWEALRLLAAQKANGQGLQHLRLIAASWDAEEAGLRGARAWVHGQNSHVELPTWNLNLECLYNVDDLFLLTSDINGSVKLSEALSGRCQRLLVENGRSVDLHPIAFLTGGTDAAELAKGGAQATTFMGMLWSNDERGSVYHTPADTLDAVSEEALAVSIELALKLAADLDAELSVE
ncbi:MAG: M28 family peptidase [Anaerolineae bacterium]|nr:M28 family peptidase [Anaerolineae bacterium]